MLQDKACDVCGTMFSPNTPQHRYCTPCRRERNRARRPQSKARLAPKVCKVCGAERERYQKGCDHCRKLITGAPGVSARQRGPVRPEQLDDATVDALIDAGIAVDRKLLPKTSKARARASR